MNKFFLIAAFFCASLQFCQSQNAAVTYSDEIPESASVTGKLIFNPQFSNSFIFYMAHGLTVFKQTKEFFLFDTKSLTISKKIPCPKYADYDELELPKKAYMFPLKQNLVLMYKKKNGKKYDVCAAKINEGFTVPDVPQSLFTVKTPTF